jgi:hypothetical protein
MAAQDAAGDGTLWEARPGLGDFGGCQYFLFEKAGC